MPRQSSLPFAEPEANPDPAEQFRAAMDAALNFLTARGRSSAEVRQQLRKKGFGELGDRVEARLKELGLLDDLALARAVVEDAVTRRGAAPGSLAAQLDQRGIAPDVAQRAIDEAAATRPEGDEPSRAELDLALAIATKRLRVLHGDPVSIRRRLWGFLARRGYGADVVEEVCARLLGRSFN